MQADIVLEDRSVIRVYNLNEAILKDPYQAFVLRTQLKKSWGNRYYQVNNCENPVQLLYLPTRASSDKTYSK